jgi:hypothetical protein
VVNDATISGPAGRREEVDQKFIDTFGLVVMDPVRGIR